MIKPENPANEAQRLENLLSYEILDTLTEQEFDSITQQAAEICGTKISLISLIDDKRQWFKSHFGLEVQETHKDFAFCAHAINTPDAPFIIEDARQDERFYDNPLVTGDPYVIFYAGIPLISAQGFPLGTLCVIDEQPKKLTWSQISALQTLARQVMTLIEIKKKEKICLPT